MKTDDLPLVGYVANQPSACKGSFSANMLTLTANTAPAHGLNVRATLILARISTPEDFGTLAIFIAMTSFLSAVSSGATRQP